VPQGWDGRIESESGRERVAEDANDDVWSDGGGTNRERNKVLL